MATRSFNINMSGGATKKIIEIWRRILENKDLILIDDTTIPVQNKKQVVD